jgi:hypothetical protein
MPNLEPTYLRYIHDGLINGSIHPENAAELPVGLIGMYEDAFDERISVLERQKLLQRFAIWALLKKEVSVAFVAEVLEESEDEVQQFISTYSAWFNSPVSGKYQLYHERLKVYLLQKLSEREINHFNRLLIDKIFLQNTAEFEIYRIEFFVFHLFVSEHYFRAYDFFIDYKTFLLAEKYFETSIFLQFQIDLCIRKFAQLDRESEVLELIRVKYGQLEDSLNSIITNPLLLFDFKVLNETIEASNRLSLDRKKSFWQKVIVELIQKQDHLSSVNDVLKKIDNDIECIKVVERNGNYQFQFDGISRKNFFLLLNYLLENDFETKWLIDRFDWLPNFDLSRDGILDDIDYFSDFGMVSNDNKSIVIKLLVESLDRKSFSELYRSKSWCLKFISRLSEVNSDIFLQKILFDEITIRSSLVQLYEQNEYSYTPKYSIDSLPFGTNIENWNNIISEEIENYDSIRILLKVLSNDANILNEDLKLLFLDCLNELCSITEGELADYTIQDEYQDQMILLFMIIYSNNGIDKFLDMLEFFSSNFEISLWNEYSGEFGLLNLIETILDSVLTFIIRYDNSEQNVDALLNSKFLNKCEILLCFCDLLNEDAFKATNLPKFNLDELTDFFHGEPEYLFHISICLKIELIIIFRNLSTQNKLSFYNSILFVYYSFVTPEIITKIEMHLKNKLNSKDLMNLECVLPKLIIELSKSGFVSKDLLVELFDILSNSKFNYNISGLIKECNEKALMYMTFRNNFNYSKQLMSAL